MGFVTGRMTTLQMTLQILAGADSLGVRSVAPYVGQDCHAKPVPEGFPIHTP